MNHSSIPCVSVVAALGITLLIGALPASAGPEDHRWRPPGAKTVTVEPAGLHAGTMAKITCTLGATEEMLIDHPKSAQDKYLHETSWQLQGEIRVDGKSVSSFQAAGINIGGTVNKTASWTPTAADIGKMHSVECVVDPEGRVRTSSAKAMASVLAKQDAYKPVPGALPVPRPGGLEIPSYGGLHPDARPGDHVWSPPGVTTVKVEPAGMLAGTTAKITCTLRAMAEMVIHHPDSAQDKYLHEKNWQLQGEIRVDGKSVSSFQAATIKTGTVNKTVSWTPTAADTGKMHSVECVVDPEGRVRTSSAKATASVLLKPVPNISREDQEKIQETYKPIPGGPPVRMPSGPDIPLR